jgi:cytochrome b involved in lipid metabolism
MKKLVLFSTLAFAVVLLSGCMDNTQPISSQPTQDTVMTGEITTTGETMTTTGTTSTGDTITNNTQSSQETSPTIKTITLSDITNHKTESDCRTAINGNVYDVTAFFGKHPGGDKNLFRVCGMDATEIFNKKHGNDPKANNVLAGFEIGTLAQ